MIINHYNVKYIRKNIKLKLGIKFYRYFSLILRYTIIFALIGIFCISLKLTHSKYKNVRRTPAVHKLNQRVRILCMIMTTGYRHNLEAARIYRTWTRRCDKTLFMSDDFHDEIQPVVISKNEQWGKLKESLTFVYNYHFHNADWFLRAADDNFVILENLRYLLYPYSNKTPIYFGYKMKNKDGEAYMSSSAGYVLSKEALRRFVKSALPNTEICNPEANGKESEELARCLKNVGVLAGDSRAEDGSNTFFPFSLSDYLKGLKPEDHKFLYENSFYAVRNKSFPLSKKMISFSNVHRDDLYTLEYFIYNMRLFGQKRLPAQLPLIENPVEIK